MSNKGSEFFGNISGIREVEDSIRATKKYTEGIRTIRRKHPVQGEDFPSRQFAKHYEVYPDIEVQEGAIWDLPAGTAWAWVWGDTPRIDVVFLYDYRVNKASLIVEEGPLAVKELAKAIPNFSDALAKAIANGNRPESKN